MLKKYCLYPICLIIILSLAMPSMAKPAKKGWERQKANIKASGNKKIKAIHYPKKLKARMMKEQAAPAFTVGVIDSPPIDGFVPWITVSLTDARSADDKWNMEPYTRVVGEFLHNDPNTTVADPNNHYAIGLFDTGASISLIDYAAADYMGFDDSYLTEYTVEVGGANDSVTTYVTKPLGIFINGLTALEEKKGGGQWQISNFNDTVGASNVSIAVGPDDENLPVAIGAPMAVHFSSFFNNRNNITISHLGEEYTGPEIQFTGYYQSYNLPEYPNEMPLALRPGGTEASYYPWIDFDTFEFLPLIPSTVSIGGSPSQSLLFVPGVDLENEGQIAYDKQNFMIDTGAQVTVISKLIAARLGLDSANPDFMVEIEDASGSVEDVPGFYLDSLEIISLGNNPEFTNVPVIMLDIASPEGGFLDGIIGMNLFNEYNFVLHGGAFLEAPYMTYIRNIPGDISPEYGDEKVDIEDLAKLTKGWLSIAGDADFDSDCDLDGDGIVNISDLAILAEHWGLL